MMWTFNCSSSHWNYSVYAPIIFVINKDIEISIWANLQVSYHTKTSTKNSASHLFNFISDLIYESTIVKLNQSYFRFSLK